MINDYLFSAIYNDGKVTINDKEFEAGYFTVQIMNHQILKDDISKLSDAFFNNSLLLRSLSEKEIDRNLFISACNEYDAFFDTIKKLEPFNIIDLRKSFASYIQVFNIHSYNIICNYFEGDKKYENLANHYIYQIENAFKIYSSLPDQLAGCCKNLRSFVNTYEEIEDEYNEEHLLPIANDLFNFQTVPVYVEYIPIYKKSKPTVGRKIMFMNFKSFIVTDFFEGLHYGHRPFQCAACNKYFLMLNARRQLYCDGIYPHLISGRKFSCRQVGAQIKRKETAKDNPINTTYRNRCGNIRDDQCKGKITAEFAEKAKRLAKKRYERAIIDCEYYTNQYKNDMKKNKLYADVKSGKDI